MAKIDRILISAIILVGLLYLFWGSRHPQESAKDTIVYPPRPIANENVKEEGVHDWQEAKKPPLDWAAVTGEPKKVLVTGAAGFIGMHLALQLSKRGNVVVGLDNFNSYYDLELKRDRAYELKKEGVHVVKGDVCDKELLMELFREHGFTHVAHMAAQAGVRWSLTDPLAYVRSNVMCFVTLLEAVRSFPGVKVTYASSSSVYGRNTKVPFSVKDPIDQQSSIYAATKKSNEDIARVYHHLYHIPLTGLRFFTVYGPWGRPDMAVYDFSERMFSGRPIDVYSHGLLSRDFTYIDDIVNGVVAAINYGATLEVFNLGKGHPEKVNELIEIMEKTLGIQARRNELPMQPGDVAQTWADISETTQALGFLPTTDLQTGIAKWAQWYLVYRDYRQRGPFDEQNKFLDQLAKEAEQKAVANRLKPAAPIAPVPMAEGDDDEP